uniref:Uncharacterized protein n=1 Tax=Rangifer tarandus platyrhynchus TaxID=3082113 RepID=A0ACB0FAB4_RANTA|nr:unnamed protein product [Rangifer tarandus platyrhynchus]
MCVGPCGRALAAERCQAGHPSRRGGHTALSTLSSGQARPPPHPNPLPEVAGGCPGLLRCSPLPLTGPRGACGHPPHRVSASKTSPGDGLLSRSRLFLVPARRPLRRCAHGCDCRVALQVAFRAPPPEQPRAHWLAALLPVLIGSPPLPALIGSSPPHPLRSLARSTPALIGPRLPGADTASLRPSRRRLLSRLSDSGLGADLESDSLCGSATE